MTAIIRAASAHEFLALVPALAGFLPRRSLVCVAFVGNRTAGVLRHDLPADAAEHDALVAAVVGTICRMPAVDAVVPIVYTDDTFHARDGIPERALLELVVHRAEQAGFLIRDALCSAGDAWASLLDPDAPSTGRSLSLISQSEAAREAPNHRSPFGGTDQSGGLPRPDPTASAEIAAALQELGGIETAEGAIAHLGRFADPVELVEWLLTRSHRHAQSRRLAWFVQLASRPPVRDAMMLQIAFGSVVADLALDATDAGAQPESAVSAASLDEVPGLGEPSRVEVDDLLARLLLGQTMLRPDRGRLERGLDMLRRLIANSPEDARPGTCCIAAWLAWALGRGSVAGALLDVALAIDPGHSMARLLDDFIGTGALPEWAFGGGPR